MDKKGYLIIMRVVDAALFVLAVLFLIIDAFYMRYIFRILFATFFCSAAVLLIISSIFDLFRMEKFVKKIELIESTEKSKESEESKPV